MESNTGIQQQIEMHELGKVISQKKFATRGSPSYVSVCLCGWSSALCQTEYQATEKWKDHATAEWGKVNI